MNNKLTIDSLLILDDTGMPKPPTIRQIIDRDIRELYRRDKTPDKKNYIADCIVIYYLGDPKSPARQAGLSDPEALKMAIKQAGLTDSYIPDVLVIRLIKRYYDENITEAGKVVENILKGIHNINLSIDAINNLLNEKLNSSPTLEELPNLLQMMKSVNDQANAIPSILKKLEEAKQNLMYEKETEVSRGGQTVLSSMDAESYEI
ncbi:MAG: hypothetical protein MR765_04110 [Tenericutes bacterium]|nr:hypothetical protein [Mycoplasmatota bacterium]